MSLRPGGISVIAVAVLPAALLTAGFSAGGASDSSLRAGISPTGHHAQTSKKKCRKKHKKKCRKRTSTTVTQPGPVTPAVPAGTEPATPGPPVYTVPANIPGDCSAPVENEIMAWLASVPDGSEVQFGREQCYGQDGTITLTGRNDLVIDGQGSEFRALTLGGDHRSNWQFVGGSNLTVRDMAVRGSDPQGTYQAGFEWQHGYSVEGTQGMTLSNVQARETWGDGVYLWRGASSPTCGDDASSARNVLISGATLERIGRQGVAVVDAEQVTLQDSTIGPVAWANVDLETDDDCEIARHVTVQNNSFGSNGWGVIVNIGHGGDPQVGDLSVIGNVQTAPTIDTGILTPDPCRPPVTIRSPIGPPALYRDGYTFSGNQFLTPNNAFAFRQIRNINVSSNSVAFAQPAPTGCNSRAGVRLTDSHTVSILGNAFTGATAVYIKDAASDTPTEAGNTTD